MEPATSSTWRHMAPEKTNVPLLVPYLPGGKILMTCLNIGRHKTVAMPSMHTISRSSIDMLKMSKKSACLSKICNIVEQVTEGNFWSNIFAHSLPRRTSYTYTAKVWQKTKYCSSRYLMICVGISITNNTLPCLIVGGGGSFTDFAEKRPKMAISEKIIKDFEKSKRVEALKWYFLHPPGQEEQFKAILYPLPWVFKKFCLPPFYYDPPYY